MLLQRVSAPRGWDVMSLLLVRHHPCHTYGGHRTQILFQYTKQYCFRHPKRSGKNFFSCIKIISAGHFVFQLNILTINPWIWVSSIIYRRPDLVFFSIPLLISRKNRFFHQNVFQRHSRVVYWYVYYTDICPYTKRLKLCLSMFSVLE